jgi:NAD(P)-dependent dehydrogenase (short-subunit alcohol dehydrogenase family)
VKSLEGKVVLIAGATGTAGQVVAKTFADAGAILILNGRDQARLDESVAMVDSPRVESIASTLDTPEACSELVRQIIDRHQRLDGVIYLVGGWRAGGVEGFLLEDLNWLYEQIVVTTAGVVTASREPLLKSGGRFVAVSSTAVHESAPGNAAYAGAKAAADAWIAALAGSFEGSGAATVTFEVKALLTEQMQRKSPERKFPGWTRVEDLAAAILANWSDAGNGARIPMSGMAS